MIYAREPKVRYVRRSFGSRASRFPADVSGITLAAASSATFRTAVDFSPAELLPRMEIGALVARCLRPLECPVFKLYGVV